MRDFLERRKCPVWFVVGITQLYASVRFHQITNLKHLSYVNFTSVKLTKIYSFWGIFQNAPLIFLRKKEKALFLWELGDVLELINWRYFSLFRTFHVSGRRTKAAAFTVIRTSTCSVRRYRQHLEEVCPDCGGECPGNNTAGGPAPWEGDTCSQVLRTAATRPPLPCRSPNQPPVCSHGLTPLPVPFSLRKSLLSFLRLSQPKSLNCSQRLP